ncbi:hypothetical protein [Streptomyces sp. CG 926]|uniref:hypothetical protein n=1 Tax=Streptomyces sp. CG 926 TaxID=1882405 RepID=UPI0011B7CB01|nr:hypothetical protein [Streptomyces sp. CG 926]
MVVVVVLFVSSVVTAVSTLVTAVGVVRRSTMDWRPAEYSKLRSLRGGHTIERFTQVLGHASYRVPMPEFVYMPDEDNSGLTKHVFRPHEDYRVEVITDRTGATLVYAVTSCSPAFTPSFEVNRNSEKGRFTITLGSPLADVGSGATTVYQWMTRTGARQSAVSQRESTGDEDGKREYAWGSTDVCPLTSEEARRESDSLWSEWEAWRAPRTPDADDVYTAERSDPPTRSLMERSAVNVYVETAPQGSIHRYYPALLGVNRSNAD